MGPSLKEDCKQATVHARLFRDEGAQARDQPCNGMTWMPESRAMLRQGDQMAAREFKSLRGLFGRD